MRIGIDLRLAAYRPGGIARYADELVAALAGLGEGSVRESLEVILLQASHDRIQRSPPGDSRFVRHDVRTPSHHRFERLTLAAEIAGLHLDVLHSPDSIPPRAGARRRVVTIMDLSFLHFPDHHTAESLSYYREQIAWAAHSADHVLTPSEHTRADIVEQLGLAPERVTCTSLAAPRALRERSDPDAVAATLAAYGLSAGYVLFVGTLEPRKNVALLCEAHRLLRASGFAHPLVLVGRRGWQCADTLRRLAEPDLAPHVRLFEDVDDLGLAHLYAAAGVLALPSFLEGFGLPILEAMHQGCPVVASDRGALPEIVGPAGLLLPPEDARAWADALARVVEDAQARSTLVGRGLRRANEFSWQDVARRTLAVYRAA